MENEASWDRNLLVGVLAQGEEMIKQLEAHLDEPAPYEFCKSLALKIQSKFQTAISMAKSIDPEGSRHPACPNNTGSDSPHSASGSPLSENSDSPFNDHERKETPKKRKTMPKWTSRVRVCSGTGIEGPLDDGYSWRKYGQKDILGAKYPRGYYRCTHRNAQGCAAKKQVQRTDEDPSVFDVTYQGAHTCLQRPQLVPMQQKHQEPQHNQVQQQQQQQQDQHLLLSFQTGLDIKTEGLEPGRTSPPFSFPSTQVGCMKPENQLAFSLPSSVDHQHLMGTFSPTFVSTAASKPAFSLSQCQMSSYPEVPNPRASELELQDIVSAATSAVNSPIIDMDFLLQPVEMDADFLFDASNFF